MPSQFINNIFSPGKYNNYLIAGNITNAFAIGEIGSTDDFFLVGAEPTDESSYPLLTGNILDSEGKLLFRLVNNIIVFNPGHCSKILGNMIGYEIHDSADKLIFKVETVFQNIAKLNDDFFITTINANISANFYDKNKELVFKANSGEEDENIESKTKTLFGFTGGFGFTQGYNQDELQFLRYVLGSRGKINEPIRGLIENQDIILDGKAVQNANIKNCKIVINQADFVFIGNNIAFEGCKFEFNGQAGLLFDIIKQLNL